MSGSPVDTVAFLGCGDAARLHSGTLQEVATGVRRVYASRDGAKARAFVREHDGARAHGSYGDALADPEVDAVLVLTPPAHHAEWTEKALDAGKDVIVEKPAFPSSRDFGPVEAAIRRTGRRVLVAENYHYKPLARALRRMLARETLGELRFLRVDAVKSQDGEGWRADPDRAGGGALLEGGIHWVSLLAHLGPTVRSVRAVAPGAGGEDGAVPERSMALLLDYEGPGVASLAYSWEVPSPLKGLRLSHAYGTDGAATFESNGLFLAVRGREWRLRFPGFRDIRGYRAMFRDFFEALETGRPADFTLEDARRDVELVEAAYRDADVADPAETGPDAPPHLEAGRDTGRDPGAGRPPGGFALDHHES